MNKTFFIWWARRYTTFFIHTTAIGYLFLPFFLSILTGTEAVQDRFFPQGNQDKTFLGYQYSSAHPLPKDSHDGSPHTRSKPYTITHRKYQELILWITTGAQQEYFNVNWILKINRPWEMVSRASHYLYLYYSITYLGTYFSSSNRD